MLSLKVIKIDPIRVTLFEKSLICFCKHGMRHNVIVSNAFYYRNSASCRTRHQQSIWHCFDTFSSFVEFLNHNTDLDRIAFWKSLDRLAKEYHFCVKCKFAKINFKLVISDANCRVILHDAEHRHKKQTFEIDFLSNAWI